MSSKPNESHLFCIPDVVFESGNACALINESIARNQFAANLAPVRTRLAFVTKVGKDVYQEFKMARVNWRWLGNLLRRQSIWCGLWQTMPNGEIMK